MKKATKLIYWTPRILSIAFICFLSLFSLDVFEPGMTARDIAIGLFMHNIPSLVLIALLIIAWRKEIVGAIAFIGAGLTYVGFTTSSVISSGLKWYIALSWSSTIAGPAFLIGILFLIDWQNRKKGRSV